MSRVLLIDDDPAVIRLVSIVLTTDSIDVAKAYSGEEGMAYLEDGHGAPDLILVDLAMPGMGGREFFRQARSYGYKGPIIFCSAYGATDANRELGGQGSVEKPFDPEILLDSIRSQLSLAANSTPRG
jgi:DNA-binding response OmpR family regulator